MEELEQLLSKKKIELDKMEIPEELEARLSNALRNRSKPRAGTGWKMKLAAGFVVLMLVSYNVDSLAYYSKKLVGYEQVMNGTLKQLNELGRGQLIGKSFTFNNGVTLTLDGVMLDQNQMVTFYTVSNERGNIDEINISTMMTIKGIFGNYLMKSASGNINDDKTEIKYIASFDTPGFFEKRLRLCFTMTKGATEQPGEIAFTLDRNKAMGYTFKKDINKAVEVDETKIVFKSIMASPTKTVIKGSARSIVELAVDQLQGERFRPGNLDIELIANGEAVPQQGGGMSTDFNGITFHRDYDALPVDLEKLQIKLLSFGADHDVNLQFELRKGTAGRSITILGQNLEINKVYESDGDTYVTITTEDSVVLTRVYLISDGKKNRLQETISDVREKKPDGTIYHKRTLRFKGTGGALQLDVQRMTYEKMYNRLIDIQLN